MGLQDNDGTVLTTSATTCSTPGLEKINENRWAARPSDLLWRTWDDNEFVLYHVPSGDTHLLNRVAAEALRALENDSLSSRELAKRIAPSLDRLPDDFPHHIEKLLAQFDELGLIEPLP